MSDKIERAERTKRLMDNPELQQAFTDVEQALLNKFLSTKLDEVESMAEIRKLIHLLQSVKANLKQAIDDGKLEVFNLEQEKEV